METLEEFLFVDDKLIKNRFMIYQNNVFKLYEAVYESESYTTGETSRIPIFVLKLKFVDNDSDYETAFRKFEINKDIFNALGKNSLQKLGYYHNKEKNLLYLYYHKNDYSMFDFPSFLEKLAYKNIKIAKMQIFYDLLKIVNQCHQSEIKLSLLHPNLLFIKDELKVCDIIFELFIEKTDRIKYYQICKYFGFLDLDILENLENERLSEEETKEIYFKTDILMLNVILAFLFSTKVDGKCEEARTTLDQIIIQLQKDFFMQTKRHCLLECCTDKDIQDFLQQYFNFNFSQMPGITKYLVEFKELLDKAYKNEPCCECQEKLTKTKKINYTCFDVICGQCDEKGIHKCSILTEKGTNRVTEKYESFKFQMSRLKEISDRMPMLGEKQITEYFVNNLRAVFNEILEEQNKIKNIIFMEEEKLNCIIYFLEDVLSQRNKEENQLLITLLNRYKHELENLQVECENVNKVPSKKRIARGFTNLVKSIVTPGGLLNTEESNRNEGQGDIEKIINERIDFNSISEAVEKQMKDYEEFLNNTKIFKETVNNNVKIQATIDLIDKSAQDYLQNIESCFKNEFLEGLKQNSNKISELVENNYLLKSNKFTVNLQKTINKNSSQLVGYLDSEKGCYSYYDVEQGKLYKDLKLRFYERKLVAPLKYCRYINLGSRLLVTGGCVFKNEKWVPSSVGYIIDLAEREVERRVEYISNMNWSRDQHMMIKIDDLSVMCVGGYETNSCEVFNFLTDAWEQKPELNVARYNSTTYLYNGIDVYVCFGVQTQMDGNRNIPGNEKIMLESVERLSLHTEKPTWNLIRITSDILIELSLCGVIPLDDDTIYLVGGAGKYENVNYSECYFLHLNDKSLRRSETNLSNRVCFIEPTFYKLNDEEWIGFGSDYMLTKISTK
jgi:hypothetical protein